MPSVSPRPGPRPPILIVGGSVRFLAASCRRAGWAVYAADRFGDADLLAVAHAYQPLPADLAEACVPFPDLPAMPFLFTGGLENSPAFLSRLAAACPTAAASPGSVLAVRDFANLASAAAVMGLTTPETHTSPTSLPTDGSYLVKPLASVGGLGISRWHGGPAPATPSLWQRHHTGVPHGVSVLLRDQHPPELLGVCRSLHNHAATSAPGWAYAGSVSVATPAWSGLVIRLAERLGTCHGLRGAIGIDCLVTPSGEVVVLEVNPRPTASMELFERTAGLCIASRHLDALAFPSPLTTPCQASGHAVSGKAILYSDRAFTVTSAFHAAFTNLAEHWAPSPDLPPLADLPRINTHVESGSPILTVFADSDSEDAVETLLTERLAALRTICRAAAP